MIQNVERPGGSRARVLVVDDDRAVSKALERSLRQLGYDVLVAGDGTEGLEQALRAEPAVVLADVHMPGMDGHALLRRLMRSGLHSSVILMSGQGELDDAIGAFREGAIDYLKKPWTLQDLSAALQRAMGLAGALRDLTVSPLHNDHDRAGSPSGAATPVDAAAFVEEVARKAEAPLTAETLPIPPLRPAIRLLRRGPAAAGEARGDTGALIAESPRLSAAVLRAVGGVSDASIAGDPSALLASDNFDGVHEALEALALRDVFPIPVAALRTLNDRIWRFSLARALAMRGIADISDLKASHAPHTYFLSGLLLDVGASFLLAEIAAEMQRRDSGVTDSASMMAAVAAHHAEVGAVVLRRWESPADWIELGRSHHLDPPSVVGQLYCAALIGGALAVRVCGFSDPSGDRDLRSDALARCAYTLGLGDTGLRRLTKSLTDEADAIWAACT